MGCVICSLAVLTVVPFVWCMALLAAARGEPDPENDECPTTEELVGIILMIGDP